MSAQRPKRLMQRQLELRRGNRSYAEATRDCAEAEGPAWVTHKARELTQRGKGLTQGVPELRPG